METSNFEISKDSFWCHFQVNKCLSLSRIPLALHQDSVLISISSDGALAWWQGPWKEDKKIFPFSPLALYQDSLLISIKVCHYNELKPQVLTELDQSLRGDFHVRQVKGEIPKLHSFPNPLCHRELSEIIYIVGGFNPIWKILYSQIGSPQVRVEIKKCIKPPPSHLM